MAHHFSNHFFWWIIFFQDCEIHVQQFVSFNLTFIHILAWIHSQGEDHFHP